MRVTGKRVGCIGVLALATVTGLGAQTLPYKLVENWGTLPGGEPWGEVTGVEIDRAGTIIAVRRSEPPVVELDGSGKVLKTWGPDVAQNRWMAPKVQAPRHAESFSP